MNQPGYYAVKWGKEENVRLTGKSVSGPAEACKETYGLVTANMRVKFLSSRVADIRKVGFRTKALQDPKGWELVPTVDLPKLERFYRCQRCDSPINEEGLCTDQTCPFSSHVRRCPKGWIGHPQHPEVTEDTPCICEV